MKFSKWINKKYQKTYVYHVSPDSNITNLRPTGHHRGQQSVKMGMGGVYVAPRFRDAISWALSYVIGKKYYTQRPNQRLKEREKGGGHHGEKGPTNYKNITIYKIEVPKNLLNKKEVWGSSFWEPEYFIPEKLMGEMKIIESKTYSMDELVRINDRSEQKRWELRFNSSDNKIKEASKNNLAARYYLELLDLYNKSLLQGKKPIINNDTNSKNDHLIHQKIESLKNNYIFDSSNNWTTIYIKKLNSKEQQEVRKIYQEIKRMIENLE
jgi:hypothetical protein